MGKIGKLFSIFKVSLCWVSELDSLGNQVEDSFGTYLLVYRVP